MDRAQIKENGKAAMKANYGLCILVSLILGVTAGGSVGFSAGGMNPSQIKSIMESDSDQAIGALIIFAIIFLMVFLLIFAVSIAISAFLLKPLEIGCRNFFLQNTNGPASANLIGSGFKGNYKRNALAMFLVMLFTWLWSLLFVIPGIIMGYAYRMVPYIVAEDPNISAMDAIKKSKEMMDGHKWELFVFDLSFIGWNILSLFTCGILSIVYVNPYYYSASAVFYKTVKGYYDMQHGSYPPANPYYNPNQTYQGYQQPCQGNYPQNY